MSDSDISSLDGSIFIYVPNNAAPVFFAVAFAIAGLVHLWQCYHYKCFNLTALHIFTCLMFTVGFALREYGAFHYSFSRLNLNVYIASTSLIYMAPPLLELANYHVLGRIFYYIPYASPIHPGRVLTTFAILSSLVEALNAIGVTYTANPTLPENLTKLGDTLTKTSLILQTVVIALLYALALVFQHRSRAKFGVDRRVRSPLLTLYLSSSLILARTAYRLVEHFAIRPEQFRAFGLGLEEEVHPVLRHEWYFYVFEASLMLINSVLWNVRHPRRYLPEDYRTYLAQDGLTELLGSGWDDDRSFLVTLLDPFGLFGSKGNKTGMGKERPFWQTNGYAV